MTTPFDRFVEAVERNGARLKPNPGKGFRAVDLPCPECGSRDHEEWKTNSDGDRIRNDLDRMRLFRFVDKQGRERGGWYCNKCGEKGDDVLYMEKAYGMSFYDAHVAIMGCPPPDRPMQGRERRQAQTLCPSKGVRAQTPEQQKWRIRRNPAPNGEWQAQARLLTMRLDLRFNDAGADRIAEARHWIEEGRGIRLSNAPVFGVFWNPADKFEEPAKWGLLRERKLFIPKGIVIAMTRYRYGPHCESGSIVGLLVRRAEPSGEQDKLRWVPFRDDDDGPERPRTRTMVLGFKGQPVVVMESALDAALVYQEAQGCVAVVSTCGATYPLDEDVAEFLKEAPALWAMPDTDQPGLAAFRRWRGAFPKMRQIFMPREAGGSPVAKDATELFRLNRTRPELPTVRQILEKQGVLK